MLEEPDESIELDAATSLLDKLGRFAAGLTPGERELFAALVGPGIASAHRVDEDDVSGFDHTWEPTSLPAHLAAAIRQRRITVHGL